MEIGDANKMAVAANKLWQLIAVENKNIIPKHEDRSTS